MSTFEGMPTTPPEQAAVVAHELLQERLGVSEEVARDLAAIQVTCPVEVNGQRSQQSLGEFVVSEHAAKTVGDILEVAREEIDSGQSHDRALRTALGASAVRMDKETGKLMRMPSEAEQVKKK